MVSIFTGLGAGLERGSGNLLGGSGLLGSGALGRSGAMASLNAATGNLVISQQDEFLVGRGPDASVSRTYNSETTLTDDLSPKWQQNTARRVYGLTGVIRQTPSTVKRVSSDGSEITYNWDGSKYVTSDGAGAYDTMTVVGTGSSAVWTWTDGATQQTETYAADPLATGSWRITAVKDTLGQAVTYSYDDATDGHLSTIQTSDGGTLTYGWVATNKRITSISTAYTDYGDLAHPAAKTLTRTYYAYDTSGRLGSVTVDLTPADGATADGAKYVTTYSYDGSSNRIASITETDGSVTSFAYNTAYQVTSITQLVSGGVTPVTRVTTISYGSGTTTITDPAGKATVLSYDTNDRLTSITSPAAVTDAAQQVVQFAYDANGNVTSVTDADGKTTTRTFDSVGNVLTEKDPLGHVTTNTYGSKNELLTSTVSEGIITAYNDLNSSSWGVSNLSVASAGTLNGAPANSYTVISSGYDAMTTVGTAINNVGTNTYSFDITMQGSGSNTTGQIAFYGNSTYWGDDSDSTATIVSGPGQLTRTTGGLWTVTNLTGATRVHIERTYHTSEQISARVIVGGSSPLAGNALLLASPQLAVGSNGALPFAPQTTRFVYDANNELTYTVSAEGRVSKLSYDGNGNATGSLDYTASFYDVSALPSATAITSTQMTDWEGTVTDKSTVQVSAMVYDPRGNLRTSQSFSSATSGGVGTGASQTTTYIYDQAGELLSRSSSAGSTESFLYDGMGRVVASTDANGATTHIVFNDAASTTVVTTIAGLTTTSTYDKTGGLLSTVESYGLAPGDGVIAAYSDLNGGAWATNNLTVVQNATTLNGVSANNYTVTNNGFDQLVTSGTPISNSGTHTYSFEISIKGSGSPITSTLGLYGSSDSWGNDADSTATIVSGPGTITHYTGGLWTITGLSITAETRVHIERTVSATEQVSARFYVGGDSPAAGNAVFLGSPQISVHTPSTTTEQLQATSSNQYDQLGRLSVTIDATGRKSYYIYDAVSRLVGMVDHYGTLTEYRYDADDRRVAAVTYATLLTSTQMSALTSSTAIATIKPAAATGDLWSWKVYDADGRTIEAIGGDGSVVTYGYDASDRLIATKEYANKLIPAQLLDFMSAAPTSLVTPATDNAHDVVSRTFYDADGLMIGALDGLGYLTRTDYDKAGRKVTTTQFAMANGDATPAKSSFKTLGDNQATNTNDRTSRWLYDDQGRLRYSIDPLNHVVEYVYTGGVSGDASGVVRTTIAYASAITPLSTYTLATVAGALSSNAGDRKTWAVYDAVGRLAYAIDASGAVTRMTYDAYGRATKTTVYATARATATLPTLATMDGWASSNANSTTDRVTRSYYTALNQLRYTVDAGGYVTRFDYDAEGRQIATVRWATALTAATVTDATTIDQIAGAVTGASITASTSYDMDGRVATTTDGEGFVTSLAYNINGTLASTTAAKDTSGASQTSYGYDAAGRQVSVTEAVGATEVRTTSKTFDGLGNLLAHTDANGNVTTFTYDRAGRILTSTDPLSHATSFSYDAFDDIVSTTDVNGNTSTAAFDQDGNLLTSTNALAGTTTYQYNAFDEVVKTTDVRGNASYSYHDMLGRIVYSRDAEDYVTESSYTVFGELASLTPRATKATNTASVSTLPTYATDTKDATTGFSYDKLGRAISTTDAEGHGESSTFDAFGNKLTTTSKLGATTSYTYDRRGLVISEVLPISSVTASGTTQATSVTNTYAYDARGNRTSMTEASGLSEARTTTWIYDKLDRVIETHLPAVQNTTGSGTVSPIEYTLYDHNDNVIEQKDAAAACTLFYYDQLNRQIASISAIGTYSTTSYGYGAGINGGTQTSRTWGTPVSLPTTAGGTPPATPGGTDYRESVSTFDKLGRLVSTSIAGVRTGSWNGTTYSTSVGTVTSSWTYDAAGNATSATDGNGKVSYTYYDKLGRKTAGIDALGYLTTWTLNADGNVLSEQRWATATTGAGPTAQPAGTANANDRITTFTYDKLGRRLTETRTGLDYNTINATSGALTAVSGSSGTVTYTYNNAGEVLTKAEATGDTTTYTYDTAGRLIVESRAGYTDQTNTSVTPTVRYSYDGLGNLTRTQQGGATVNNTTDRITGYSYGAGGRLTSMTDPTGAVHSYYYDIVGHKIGEAYDRVKSDASVAHEGIAYQYDAAGQLIQQNFATVSSGTFTTAGDTITLLAYNAYGELTSRSLHGTGLGGSDTGTVVQEQNRYDNAGHLEASDAGDGVWRYYIYDAAGNRTAVLEDEGLTTNGGLRNRAMADVLSIATNSGATTVGHVYIDGINATLTQYDARNQATLVTQTRRQLNDSPTASIISDISSSQTYNAFGETLTETDALGHTTTYAYNAMGRVVIAQHAAVSVGNEDGTTTTGATPTDTFYYDRSGRLIGQMDANSHVSSRLLLAGTGYGDAEALVAKEYHPDSGIKVNGYDVYGDLRDAADELSRHTTSLYDGLGGLTQVTHPAGAAGALIDTYSYDVLGQRIAHSNNYTNSSLSITAYKETSDYDVQGRIVSQRALGGVISGTPQGDLTTNSYVWSSSLATTGLDTFGGTQTTTAAAGTSAAKTTIEVSDGFDHVISHADMGGHTSATTYDTAGRIVERGGAETQRYSYLNTGLTSQVSAGTGTGTGFAETAHATYTYDLLGEKLTEYATNNTVVIQNATATYDALGRMATWSEAGSTLIAAASVTWSYDAVGNIRSKEESYKYMNSDGSFFSSAATPKFWYRYDAMNRVTVTQGYLSGGTISGIPVTYDAAGERATVTNYVIKSATIQNPGYDPDLPHKDGNTPTITTPYNAQSVEHYSYNADGTLASVRIADSGYTDNGDGTVTVNAPTGSGDLKSTFTYDLMGRETRQQDWTGNGTGVAYDRLVTFDAKGRVASESDTQKQGADTLASTITNDYRDAYSNYALGAVLSSTDATTKNGGSSVTSSTATSYAWYDGAVQSGISYKPTPASRPPTPPATPIRDRVRLCRPASATGVPAPSR